MEEIAHDRDQAQKIVGRREGEEEVSVRAVMIVAADIRRIESTAQKTKMTKRRRNIRRIEIDLDLLQDLIHDHISKLNLLRFCLI